MAKNPVRDLNRRFLEQIPLTGQIGLKVTGYDDVSLTMTAPLAPNRNDKGTGFAGSIAALATLAGWALITLWVEERRGPVEVAVVHSEMRYRRPITGDFFARAFLPEDETPGKLLSALDEKGRGRLEVTVVIGQEDVEAVDFKGTYAVKPAVDRKQD